MGEKFRKDVLSEKVVTICSEQGVTENDCELLIEAWLEDIAPDQRPSTSAVLMQSKRKIYKLVAMPY